MKEGRMKGEREEEIEREGRRRGENEEGREKK